MADIQYDLDVVRRKLNQRVKINEKGCWCWTGMKNFDGYGQIRIVGRRKLMAHRLSYEATKGPIPEGLLICHHCDNPGCINPCHLYAGTQKQNIHDVIVRGRRPGARPSMRRLTQEQAETVRSLRAIYTRVKLAEMFGVPLGVIGGILSGKNYRTGS